MKRYAILVAGGSGNRMNAGIPKQFLLLSGKPLLQYALEVFHAYDPGIELVIVLPAAEIPTWNALLATHRCAIPHQQIEGGPTRFHSVANGLAGIGDDGIVAIHDGVRPLLSESLVDRCMKAAAESGSAIPCVPVSESMRMIEADKNFPVDRSQYFLIQTPQCFRVNEIKQAYLQHYLPEFTDDATVYERSGYTVRLVEGERWNIKITYPVDLEFAKAILAEKATS